MYEYAVSVGQEKTTFDTIFASFFVQGQQYMDTHCVKINYILVFHCSCLKVFSVAIAYRPTEYYRLCLFFYSCGR